MEDLRSVDVCAVIIISGVLEEAQAYWTEQPFLEDTFRLRLVTNPLEVLKAALIEVVVCPCR